MKWIWYLGFFLIAVLAGCGPRDVTVIRDDWTGTRSFVSPDYEIFRKAGATVTARPVILTNAPRRTYAVMMQVNRDDVNGPRIDRMTLGRTALAYRRLDRVTTRCASGCLKSERGVITMNRQAFDIAARTGLPLRIWGQRGRYEGTVPAAAFAAVLDDSGL